MNANVYFANQKLNTKIALTQQEKDDNKRLFKAITSHRLTFKGTEVIPYDNRYLGKMDKDSYQFAAHELRYRRFLLMRKNNPQYFDWSETLETLLKSVSDTCNHNRKYFKNDYNYLLKIIQENKVVGVWGITYFGRKDE